MTLLQRLLDWLLPEPLPNYSPHDLVDDDVDIGEMVRECRALRVENAFLKSQLAQFGQTPTSLELRLKLYKQQLKALVRAS